MSLQVNLGPGVSAQLDVRKVGTQYLLTAIVNSQWCGDVTASIDLVLPPELQGSNITGVHTAFRIKGPGFCNENLFSKSLGELNGHAAQQAMSEPITGSITVGQCPPVPIRTTWSELSRSE
jgi:hypothetical protein